MDTTLKELVRALERQGLSKYASRTNALIYKYAEPASIAEELDIWADALREINKPWYPPSLNKAMGFFNQAAPALEKASKELSGIPKDEAKRAIIAANKVITAVGQDGKISAATLKRLSMASNNEEIVKIAGVPWLKTILKGIPWIGVVFSAYFALKNIYLGFLAFTDLFAEASALGEDWHVFLNLDLDPNRILNLAEQHQDDPDKIVKVDKLAKSVKQFWRECIGLFWNSLDAAKDLIFLFLDVGSAGLGTVVDIGLSITFMILDGVSSGSLLKSFDEAIILIQDTVVKKYTDLMDSMDFITFNSYVQSRSSSSSESSSSS